MDQRTPQPAIKHILGNIFLVFAAITLPGSAWSMFGWLHAFLPLIVFTFLCRYGVIIGSRFILAGSGLAAITGIIVPSLSLPVFSFSMIPAGYMLARSGLKGESPALSGLKGAAVLAGCWALLIAALGVTTGVSPFNSLIDTLNTGIGETLSHYRQSGSLDPEAMMVLESTLYQMKVVLPIIMPAIFICCALFTIWVTMVLGNRLAVKLCNLDVWPKYRFWQLPDKLIWLAIGCALPAVLPGLPRNIAVNLLIILSLVYCFQGFALCVFFMDKWRVPLLFRSFIYVMIVFQSFGTLALLMAGVADVWFDFRKLNPEKPKSDEDSVDE